MRQNVDFVIGRGLKHEGGYVNHPRDPGGPTNMGITLGTMRRLGYDVDGDGDVDVMDVKKLKKSDAIAIYKRFYWDPVQGDLLPSGLDLTMYDYGINSGVSRPAKALQRIIGVAADGQIGPRTLTAVAQHDPVKLIRAVNKQRLSFMKRAKDKRGRRLWLTFGKGWQRRVDDILKTSIELAYMKPVKVKPKALPKPGGGFWTWLINLLFGGTRK